MISSSAAAIFRKVKPKSGFHIRRWGPSTARWIDELAEAGLISWGTDSNYPGRVRVAGRFYDQMIHREMGIRLVLTRKGKVVSKKF